MQKKNQRSEGRCWINISQRPSQHHSGTETPKVRAGKVLLKLRKSLFFAIRFITKSLMMPAGYHKPACCANIYRPQKNVKRYVAGRSVKKFLWSTLPGIPFLSNKKTAASHPPAAVATNNNSLRLTESPRSPPVRDA